MTPVLVVVCFLAVWFAGGLVVGLLLGPVLRARGGEARDE
jgi:hypothetical protein